MRKWIKYLFPVICVIVVIITFVLLFEMKEKAPMVAKLNETNAEKVENNTNIENTNVVDDKNTNTNTNTDFSNDTSTVDENTQSKVTSDEDDSLSEDKQKKARDLAQKNWGQDSSVYFTNESVKSDNEYIVAVRDKSTTAVKNYFKVNIETEKVEIDY